jgi:hypothetical protein
MTPKTIAGNTLFNSDNLPIQRGRFIGLWHP